MNLSLRITTSLVACVAICLMYSSRSTPVDGRISRAVYAHEGYADRADTIHYEWDSLGRLSAMYSTIPLYRYRYSGDTIFEISSYHAPSAYYVRAPDGRVLSDDEGRLYEYDSHGVLTGTTDTSGDHYTCYIVNGDLMADTIRIGSGPLITHSYTYYPQVDLRSFGDDYYKMKQHLIRMETTKEGQWVDTVLHTYSFDQLGRPLMDTSRDQSLGMKIGYFSYVGKPGSR